MPYFQACVKEALRMHPAVGQLLERVVPQEGVTIRGVFLPGGTVVGMNPWVAARDKEIYGADADTFRPERWIQADEKALKLMDRNWLAVSMTIFVADDCTQSQLLTDSVWRSLGLEQERVLGRTSLSWRCQSSCPSFFDVTISVFQIPMQTGDFMIIGSSNRKA
jgi:hypothetical protein